MSILSILIVVLIVCVLLWAVRALTTAFGVPEPIRTVIFVVVVLIVLVWLLGQFGYGPGINLRV